MIIEYDITCFDRTLKIKFPDSCKQFEKEILKMLDEYYYKWHDVENIEDPEERAYVENACLEEYIIDMLSMVFNEWEEWDSFYYSDDENEN